MKKIALLLVTFICLQVVAFAVPDSVATGPYKISFDLGIPKSTYDIIIEPPKATETLGGEKKDVYSLLIDDKKSSDASKFASIEITRYESEIHQVSPEDTIEIFRKNGISDAEKRKIDGSDGVITKAQFSISEGLKVTNMDLFMVKFYLNADPKHASGVITSIYPWDEGTLSLLKTIHIERINSTT